MEWALFELNMFPSKLNKNSTVSPLTLISPCSHCSYHILGHPKYLTPLLIQTLNAVLYTVNVTLFKAVYQHMRTSPAARIINIYVDLLSRFFKRECDEQLLILRVNWSNHYNIDKLTINLRLFLSFYLLGRTQPYCQNNPTAGLYDKNKWYYNHFTFIQQQKTLQCQ